MIYSCITALSALFPLSPEVLQHKAEKVYVDAQKSIALVVVLKPEERTFSNTLQATDSIVLELNTMMKSAWALNNVSPNADIRSVAEKIVVKMQDALVDCIENNADICRAFQEYAQHSTEILNAEEKKYLHDMLKEFEKNGLGFSVEKQERIKELKKEMGQLRFVFETNINNANGSIAVTHEELAGCSQYFMDSLEKDERDNFIVGVDYPTYFTVMENCSVESTRHALWQAFNNRAYPENEEILIKLIAMRDRWAKEIGFVSYAECELSDEMAKTPHAVREFLAGLYEKSHAKVAKEMALLKKELPAGVVLTTEKQFKPWDVAYVKAQYKKKYADFDEELLKEYFPLQKTIDELLDIYQQFLGVEFVQEKVADLWHEDALCIAVYTKEKTLLGRILLDLHPRPNKYSHGCMECIVPAVRKKNGDYCPPIILLIMNFPKATADRPALFSYDDVRTFFHEFGHAMHGLFGATQMASFSGTNVKLDFVEMPSQMLEEWLTDPQMLKKMSGHYQTGEPLPDAFIAKIIEAQRFDTGLFVRRQVMQGLLSLALFDDGEQKNPHALHKELFNKYQGDCIAWDDANNFQASFGHLGEYGSRYYCYMWAQVFAQDMFAHIKPFGLLNYEIGKQYIEKVIGKGGSVEPEILIADFLGRQPTIGAFLHDLGFVTQ